MHQCQNSKFRLPFLPSCAQQVSFAQVKPFNCRHLPRQKKPTRQKRPAVVGTAHFGAQCLCVCPHPDLINCIVFLVTVSLAPVLTFECFSPLSPPLLLLLSLSLFFPLRVLSLSFSFFSSLLLNRHRSGSKVALRQNRVINRVWRSLLLRLPGSLRLEQQQRRQRRCWVGMERAKERAR